MAENTGSGKKRPERQIEENPAVTEKARQDLEMIRKKSIESKKSQASAYSKPAHGSPAPGSLAPGSPTFPGSSALGALAESLLDKMKSRRIILQRWDTVTFEGDLIDFCDNYFILNKVVITGRKHVVKPPWAIVDRTSISHVHPVCEVLDIDDQ